MNCTVCGKQIGPRTVSGLCKQHFLQHLNTDPTMKERQSNGVREWAKKNPEAVSRRSHKIWLKRRANPDGMAAMAERMRTVCQPLSCTPESVARRDNEKRSMAIRRGRNPWCPDEYRATYLSLVKNHNFTRAEARAMIEAQIKTDVARLSPFERQERSLAQGAKLIANDAAPSLYTAQAKWSVG